MTTPTRSQLLADLTGDLRSLERTLRILLLSARYVHGVQANAIYAAVYDGQDAGGTPDNTVVSRVLIDAKARDLTVPELEGLFCFLWDHYRSLPSLDPYLWPLLLECFSARQLRTYSLPIPKRADAILAHSDTSLSQLREFCHAYQGTYQCFRYGTSRHVSGLGKRPEDHPMIRFAVRIFPFKEGLGRYRLTYRGKAYVRRIEGAISVTADRAYFLGREDTRDHLSWMVWRPILTTDPGPEPGKGIVQAANPEQKLFSAVLIYRRWPDRPDRAPSDEECERWCGPTDASDEFEKQIKQEGWLNNSAKDLHILEVDDLD